MKKKRLAKVIVLVLAVTLIMSACGKTSKDPVTSANTETAERNDGKTVSDTAEPVELTMMNYYTKEESDSGDNTRKLPRDTILEFDELNPDINLDITEIQHNDYQTKIQALASANDLPDVFIVKGSWVSNFYESGLLADISSYLNQCEWKDQYRDGLFDGVTIGGAIVGAPTQLAVTTIAFYNKELWEKAGYKEFPSTWEDVFAAKGKFDEMGVDTIALGDIEKWQYNSSWASALADHITGSAWTESIIANDGTAKFTDPDFVKFLQTTSDIGSSGILNKDYESIDNQAAADLFLNGKAATTIDGYWNVEYMAATADESLFDNIGFAPVPGIAEGGKGDQGSIATGCGWYVCVNGKLKGDKLDAAAKLALYLSGPVLSQKMANVGLSGSCKAEAADPSNINILNQKYLDFVNNASSTCNIYDSRINASVIETMNDQFVELLAGATTPESAAETIQQEYEMISQ